MACADVYDLEERWRALTPEEEERANALLVDASAILASGYKAAGTEPELLKIVCCNMVRRAMTTQGDAFGVDGQLSDSIGWASTLPAGDLYLTSQERKMLRGGSRIGTARMQA